MTDGPSHYREAERLLAMCVDSTGDPPSKPAPELDAYLRLAYVHATLALAAATALPDDPRGMRSANGAAWAETAGRAATALLTAADPEPPVGWRGIDADDQHWEHRAGGWHFWSPAANGRHFYSPSSPCPPDCDEHDQWGRDGSIAYPIRGVPAGGA